MGQESMRDERFVMVDHMVEPVAENIVERDIVGEGSGVNQLEEEYVVDDDGNVMPVNRCEGEPCVASVDHPIGEIVNQPLVEVGIEGEPCVVSMDHSYGEIVDQPPVEGEIEEQLCVAPENHAMSVDTCEEEPSAVSVDRSIGEMVNLPLVEFENEAGGTGIASIMADLLRAGPGALPDLADLGDLGSIAPTDDEILNEFSTFVVDNFDDIFESVEDV